MKSVQLMKSSVEYVITQRLRNTKGILNKLVSLVRILGIKGQEAETFLQWLI